MSYTLNKTDGSVLLTLADTTANTTYGVSFFGANYEAWGERFNENFIALLENFANNTAPSTTSVKGQIWYDTSIDGLKAYDGSAYIQLAGFVKSSTSPTGQLGRLWLDSDDDRMYVYNGSAFKSITPGTIALTGDVTGSGTMNATTGNYSIAVTSVSAATNSFTTVAVSGQSNVVADSGSDTLTLVAGTGTTLTTDATTDTITFAVDTSAVVTNSNTLTISGTKTFSGTLKATGSIELGGATKAIYADLSPSANAGIRYSSPQWELSHDGSTWARIATGSVPPVNAQYITLANDSTLSNERVLTAGTGISLTDAGAGSTVTLANTGVTALTTSSGLSTNTSATGSVSITNTGVTSFNGSAGAITNYAFGNIIVSGQSDIVADSGSDTLTLVAGSNITLTTNATTDTVTIAAGSAITYGISSEINGAGAALCLTGSNSTTDNVVFASGSGITITRTDADTITIATSGSSGITSAYTAISDGSNNAAAVGTDTIKFRGGTGVTATVGSNDATWGDNVQISVQDGSTSQKGLIQLSDSGSSTSTSLAATANLANTKLPKSGGTVTGAVTISDATASTTTSTGALIVTGGVGVGGNAYVGGNLVLTGNLTVNGTTTTINATTTTVDDPVFTIGGDTAPVSDDNKDRGIEFRYHNGTAAKVGFFGYDDSTGRFSFIPDATNTSEVFSGTVGDAEFGTVYAKATSAQYADLAERYEADAFYEPGTVLVVGGEKEVTICSSVGDIKLAGVVSTKPAYLMNNGAGSDVTHPAIALKGRVPVKVFGAVHKGDLLTTSAYAGHAELASAETSPMAIIGVALGTNVSGAGVIEIMIK
jgi:hypothetical protein